MNRFTSRSATSALAGVLLSASVLCFLGATPAAAADARLTVNFIGIKRPAGVIMAGVFDSEAAFKGGEPLVGARIPVSGATAAQTLTGLKPGRYAIKAYHDLNGDGRMNTNPFGMPTEPYAASNNAPSRMGPPAWSDATFEITAGGNVQTITID